MATFNRCLWSNAGRRIASEAEFVASVFQNGAVAGWVLGLDDLTSLFKANDGVANVAADGDTVGMALSKRSMGGATASAFIAAQSETLINGGFGSATGWTLEGGATIAAGVGNTIAGTSRLRQDVLTSGSFYRVTATVLNWVSGVPQVQTGGVLTSLSAANGTYSIIGLASAAVLFGLRTAVCSWDNISAKLACSIAFTQSGGTLRPKWRIGNTITFDGVDDVLSGSVNALASASAGTLMIRAAFPASISATQLLAGLSGSGSGRLFIGANASGQPCAGIGSDSSSTIHGASTTLNGKTGCLLVRYDGSNVKLDWIEDDQAISHEYSAAQNGSPSATVTFNIGAYNNNGTASSFCNASLKPMGFYVARAINDNEVSQYAAFMRSYN